MSVALSDAPRWVEVKIESLGKSKFLLKLKGLVVEAKDKDEQSQDWKKSPDLTLVNDKLTCSSKKTTGCSMLCNWCPDRTSG